MVLRRHGLIALAAVLAAVSGCSARYVRSESAPPAAQIPAASMSRHVVVVSIDGLRPDAIREYGAATMQRLIREGSSHVVGENDRSQQDTPLSHVDAHRTTARAARCGVEHRRDGQGRFD